MNNYRFLEMRVDTLGRKKMTQGELAKELNIDRNRIQQLETSPKVIPKEEELRAYCEHFNTTSDYLLGIRKTKPLDENIAMINKSTGLNEKAIETLKILKKSEYIDIINFIMSDYALFGRFLSNLSLYFDNDYDTPVHYDKKLGICVESDDITDSPIISTNGEKYMSIGKKLDYDVCGNPAYETIHVPVSILESHALHCIQAQIDDWKQKYKKGSD